MSFPLAPLPGMALPCMTKPAIMRAFLVLPLFALATPLAAQKNIQPDTPTEAPAAQPSKASPSPAYLAAAQKVAAQLWQDGMAQDMLTREIERAAENLLITVTAENVRPISATASVEAIVESISVSQPDPDNDPHYTERKNLALAAVRQGWKPLFEAGDNIMRDAFAESLLKRFTHKQLTQLHRLFAKPAGQIYAREWFPLLTDKITIKALDSLYTMDIASQDMVAKRYKEATAHLPPMPVKDTDSSAADDAVAAANAAAEAAADAAAEADTPATETHDVYEGWSKADSDKSEELYRQWTILTDKQQDISNRITLHSYESRLRAGQSLTPAETRELKDLRKQYREKP